MIDQNYMKRVQTAVNRDKTVKEQGRSITIGEVRDYVYENQDKSEQENVRALVERVVNTSSQLTIKDSQNEPPKETTNLVAIPGLPKSEGGLSLPKKNEISTPTTPGGISLLEATEKYFSNESDEVKNEIVGYLTKQSINSAKDLREALQRIRDVEITLFRKVYADHQNVRRAELASLKGSLTIKQEQEARNSGNFHQLHKEELELALREFGVI